jgi:hypothetical protein
VSDDDYSVRIERRTDEIMAARPWVTRLDALEDAALEIRIEDMPPLTRRAR